MSNVTESVALSASLDLVSIIAICAFAAAMLVLAILAVVVLFRQKRLLALIHATLMQQGQGAALPVPDTCRTCGTVHAPGAAFCQNCGSSL